MPVNTCFSTTATAPIFVRARVTIPANRSHGLIPVVAPAGVRIWLNFAFRHASHGIADNPGADATFVTIGAFISTQAPFVPLGFTRFGTPGSSPAIASFPANMPIIRVVRTLTGRVCYSIQATNLVTRANIRALFN